MKKSSLYLALVINIFLTGCDSNDEKGIRDSRKEFMRELHKTLAENNIPFKIDGEGYIRYANEYKQEVEKIKHHIDEHRMNEVGSRFESDLSTEYFRKLLDENGIQYRMISQGFKEWTYWNPTSEEQQKEIEMKVVIHVFDQQKTK